MNCKRTHTKLTSILLICAFLFSSMTVRTHALETSTASPSAVTDTPVTTTSREVTAEQSATVETPITVAPDASLNESAAVTAANTEDYVLPDGIYALRNYGNAGRWMDIQYNLTTPGAYVQQYAFGTSPADEYAASGLFKIAKAGNTGRYTIRLMLNTNLSFGVSDGKLVTKEIPANDYNVDIADTFKIEYSAGTYRITPSGMSYCICANNTTASGSSGAPDSYLTIKSATSGGSQARWVLEGYSTPIDSGVYAFKSIGNEGLWMDTQYDSVDPGYHIQQYAYSSSPASTFSRGGLFKISRVANTDRYIIRSMLNNRLTFGISGTDVLTKEIPTADSDVPAEDTFRIVYNTNGYLLIPYNSSYAITARNTTASGSTGAPDSYLTSVSKSSATSDARWTMVRYFGDNKHDVILKLPTLYLGDTVTLSPITWSTQIDYNTPKIVLNWGANATLSWDETTYTGSLTLIERGPLEMNLSIYNGKGTTHELIIRTYTVSLKVAEGTYFFKNKEVGKYMQIDDDDEPDYDTNGSIIELRDRTISRHVAWELKYVEDGYYSIVSGKSGMVLSVPSGKLDTKEVALVQNGNSEAARQLWKITESDTGAYILRPKSGESYSSDWCMSAGDQFLGITDGLNVEQKAYTDDSNYKDEWLLEPMPYGVQKYSYSASKSVNCHGYAMKRLDAPEDWLQLTTVYLSTVTKTEDIGNNDYSTYVKNDISENTKADFENWLDSEDYTWDYESSFTGNGEYTSLSSNQYRVVLRTGFHNLYYNGEVIDEYKGYYDYHFWYQTHDGRWANKHGRSPSELLPSGTTPFSSGSSGWALDYTVGGTSVRYTDFYDGTVYSYIITLD